MGFYSVAKDVKTHTKESCCFFKKNTFFRVSERRVHYHLLPTQTPRSRFTGNDRGGVVGVGEGVGKQTKNKKHSGDAAITANDMKWRRQPCAHGRLQSRPLAPRFKVPRLLLEAKNVFWKKIIAGNDCEVETQSPRLYYPA